MRLQVLSLIALIGFFCYATAETPAAAYNVLQRKIALNSKVTNQILPRCFEADYDITSSLPNFCSTGTNGAITYENFAVDFYPTQAVAPFASEIVAVTLYAVYADGTEVAVPITSVIDDTVGANTYLGTTDCTIAVDGVTGFVNPGSYNTLNGCSFTYYCEDFCNSAQPSSLYIAIVTDANENENGISFDLEILSVGLNIRKLTYNTPSVINTTVSAGLATNNFLGSQFQDLFYVDLAPFNSTLLGIGAYNALTTAYTDLVFQISAVTDSTGGAPCQSSQDWNLYLNSGDLAISESIGANRIITSGNACNVVNNSTDLCTSSTLEVVFPACGVEGTYFLAVVYPDDISTSYRYTINVFFRASYPQELASYQILSNNSAVITDYIGVQPAALSDYAVQERYYLINIPKVSATDELYVTIFNVDNGVVNVEVRPADLGYNAACGIVSYTCILNAALDENVDDYCKIKIPSCDFLQGVPYWITVQGTPLTGTDVVYFSVNAAVQSIALSSVTNLAATSVQGGTLYTDINSVNEQNYNHYSLSITGASINHDSLLVVTVYPNQEQNEIVFNYNQGSLAGSYGSTDVTPGDIDGPKDSCFNSLFVCSSANKVASEIFNLPHIGGTPATNSPTPVPHCVLTIPYCQLLESTAHYFSVYGVDSSPTSFFYDSAYSGTGGIDGELGYARPVHYTITFALYNAPFVLNNSQTYNQYQFPTYSANPTLALATTTQISRQFLFTVPTSTVRQAFSEVVFLVESVTFPPAGGSLTAYAQCGAEAGPCPCYSYDLTCGFSSSSTINKCAITLPICNCPEKTFYLSVVVNTPPSQGPVTYTVAALALSQAVTSSFSVPSTIVAKLRPQDVDVYSTGYTVDGTSRYIYGADLHRYRYTATSNTAIRVTLRFSEPSASSNQALILSVGNEELAPIDPYYPYGQDCVHECIAVTHSGFTDTRVRAYGDNYCTIVLEPCNAPSGDYFFRVTGLSATGVLTEFAGADYTLEVVNDNYTPVPIGLGKTLNGALRTDEQAFYSISLSGTSLDQWIRPAIYQDAGYPNDLAVYYNFDVVAGSYEQNCYNHAGQCRIEASRSYCDFFLHPCDLQGHSTLYVTVHSSRLSLDNYYDYIYEYHQIGDAPTPYTIEIQTGAVVSLDDGIPRTGALLRRQDAYYSFTIPSGFNNIFHFNLNSEEPRFPGPFIETLHTYVGHTSPGSSNCGSGALVFTDVFNTKEFPCNAPAGLYYVRVRASNSGADYDVDPVTYTIRAWTQPILHQTLALSTTFTQSVAPLDYDQWVDYTISIPNGIADNQVLYIDIADVTNTANINGDNGVEAWLNYGQIATPSNDNPLFSAGGACNVDYLRVDNIIDAFNGTTVAQFLIDGCSTCLSNIHVTIHSVFDFPLPIQQRVSYKIRAYLQTAVTPTGFPTSSAFRTDAIAAGGFTFTFDDSNSPQASLDTTYGNPVNRLYLFQLPALSLQNFEALTVTVGNDAGLDIFLYDLGECNTFNDIPACSAAASYSFYGEVFSTSGNQSINGLSITFVVTQDNLYTQVSGSNLVLPSNGGNVTGSLNVGQFRVVQYSWTGVNLNTLPQLDISVSSNSGSVSYCYNNDVALLDPGCATCNDNADLVILSCCGDTSAVIFITIYNDLAASSNATFTVTATLTTTATGLTVSSLPLKTTTGSFTNGALYKFYSFALTPNNFNDDSVLNFRANPTGSDPAQTVYLTQGGYAGNTGDNCVSNFFSCVAGSSECNTQMPFCYLENLYGTYYIGINGASGNNSGTTLSIFVTNIVIFSVGSTGVSGTVPDIANANTDTLVHYKFQYDRLINELGLLDANVGLIITLSTSSSVNNSLSLYIRDSRESLSSNPLAGPTDAFSDVVGSSCEYDSDFAPWSCNGTDTPVNGGNIQCIANFCGTNALSFLQQGPDDYIYLSVQNNAPAGSNVPTNFKLTVQTYSTAIENTTAIFPITPKASNTDVINAVTCSTSGNTGGGCTFNQTTFSNVNKAVFKVDLSVFISSGPYDYLTYNFTSIDNTISIASWGSDSCEDDTTFLTCNPGDNCYLASPPCSTKATFFADGDASNDQSVSLFEYIAVTWSSTADFHLEVHVVTPLTVVVPLTASAPVFEQTFIMWDYRYVFVNFEIPQTHDYDFSVSVSANCNPSDISVYANPFHYVAAGTCAQRSNSLGDFSDFVPSCVSGGNYYLAVAYDHFDLLSTNVTAPEGRLHPQVRVTISASISKIAWTPLAPRCPAETTADKAVYKVTVDGENYGTQLLFEIAACNAVTSCSIKVITPLYEGDWNTAFYDQTDAECQDAPCTDNNVYCSTIATGHSTVFEIDPCSFRSGDYYVIFTQDGSSVPSIVSSYYDKKDIPVIALGTSNKYYANITTEVVPSTQWYQYFKIVTDGNNLGLEVQITFPALTEAGTLMNLIEECAFTGECTLLLDSFQLFTTDSTQWPVSAPEPSGCPINGSDIFFCTTEFPFTCFFRDLGCPRTEYLIILSIVGDIGLEPFEINLGFAASSTNSILADYHVLTPGVPLSGSVWGYLNQEEIFGSYDETGHRAGDYYALGRYYETESFDYRFNERYPYISYFQVNTAGISTTYATLIINAGVQHLNHTYAHPLVFFSNTPPSSECSRCASTFPTDELTPIEIECGLGGVIWVAVQAADASSPVSDFWIQVDIIPKATKALTIPSISGHGIGTSSATFTVETIFTVNNVNQNVVILAETVSFGSVTSVFDGLAVDDCGNGCIAVPACPLSDAILYGIDAVPATFGVCETVQTSSIVVTYQSIVTVKASTAYNYTICPEDAVSDHLYYLDVTSYNPALIDGFVFTLLDLSAEDNIEVVFGCGTLPCDTTLSFSTVTTYSYEVDIGCGGCDLFFVISPIACSGDSCVTYSFRIDPINRAGDLSGTPLTSTWLGEYFDFYAEPAAAIYDDYVVTAGSDSFVHVAVGNVNGTVTLDLFEGAFDTPAGCLISTCTTGGIFLNADVTGFNGGQSCYVFSTAVSGLKYDARVILDSINIAPTYKIQAITSWTALTSTPVVAQIIGNNRQYYKIVTSSVQSVVLHLNVVDGPRLFVELSDNPALLFAGNATDRNLQFYRTVYCHYGECRIEISTLAVHPGTTTFYVLVNTLLATGDVATDTTNIEKPTNYKISATIGTQNCAAPSAFSLSYCSGVLSSSGSYWNYIHSNLKDNEASCFFNDINCFCPIATAPCQTQLKRFACVETFRQCDTNGFVAPVCRGECIQVQELCGLFTCSYFTSTCNNARYLDAEPCSGAVSTANNTLTEEPALAPYVSVVTDPQISVNPSPTVTPNVATGSNFPTPSLSQTFVPTPTASFTPAVSATNTPFFTGTFTPSHTRSSAASVVPAFILVVISIIVLAL